jgi:ParB family chromosome partitioning protein
MEKRPALGKGLSALIPDAPEPPVTPSDVDIDRLSPNALQPRTAMETAGLEELAQSIRANGIIQPIVVRRVGERFEIIAGERRWRAALMAGLSRVPITVREVPEVEAGPNRSILELALIENIQREDLNPMDEAQAYRRLSDDHRLTQDQIASAVGKDRATVANFMRLLKLPDEVRTEVAGGRLAMGHARALLSLPDEADQRRLAREVIGKSLSVRETESLARRILDGARPSPPPTHPETTDVFTRAAEDRLRVRLGTRVRILKRKGRGRIEIEFTSEQELIRVYEQLIGEN